jgi:hypothetical protein
MGTTGDEPDDEDDEQGGADVGDEDLALRKLKRHESRELQSRWRVGVPHLRRLPLARPRGWSRRRRSRCSRSRRHTSWMYLLSQGVVVSRDSKIEPHSKTGGDRIYRKLRK